MQEHDPLDAFEQELEQARQEESAPQAVPAADVPPAPSGETASDRAGESPHGAHAGSAPPAVVIQPPPAWQRRLEAAGLGMLRWVARPRVRLTLCGALLVILGLWAVSSSLWSLVLVVVGVLMVITAWLGHRLDGQVGISWGSQGTDFTFRFHVSPVHPRTEVLPALPVARVRETGSTVTLTQADTVEAADTVEGEAHTVEIDVEELKALIAAAEAAEAAAAASAAASSAAASTPVIRALRTERGASARR